MRSSTGHFGIDDGAIWKFEEIVVGAKVESKILPFLQIYNVEK